MNVGMPTWHPHPKNPSWLLPFGSAFSGWVCSFFSASPSRLCRSACCMQLCTCNAKLKLGRMVQETMAPLPSSLQLFFGELARDDQPVHLPDVLGRPCHPIPLHQTLKEGCGGGWGEEGDERSRDPREGPRPHTALIPNTETGLE